MTLLKRTYSQKKMYIWIAAALFGVLCLFCPQRAQAASAPKITLKSVSNVTATNAQINASISNPSKAKEMRLYPLQQRRQTAYKPL